MTPIDAAPAQKKTAPDLRNPRVVDVAPVKVAVVHALGLEDRMQAVRDLYEAVGKLRAARIAAGDDIDIGSLRARLPDAQVGLPKVWHSTWALPVPADTLAIPGGGRVSVEVWVYGRAVEVLHEGPEETKPVTVQRLQEFAVKQGYRILGWREEIYLGTGPRGLRVLIRYPVG